MYLYKESVFIETWKTVHCINGLQKEEKLEESSWCCFEKKQQKEDSAVSKFNTGTFSAASLK